MGSSYEYFSRQTQEKPLQAIIRRQLDSNSKGGEEVVLDVNELARVYGDCISLGQLKISKCEEYVVFTLFGGDESDSTSSRTYVRSIKSGEILEQKELNNVVSIEPSANFRTLYATRADALGRPSKVVAVRTALPCTTTTTNSTSSIKIVYEEEDARYFVELQRSKDWGYVFINANAKTSSEVWVVVEQQQQCHDGEVVAEVQCIQERRAGLEYFVEHRRGWFYILSNAHGAENYGVFRVPVPEILQRKEDIGGSVSESSLGTGVETWTPVHVHVHARGTDIVSVEDIDVYDWGILVYERHRGMPKLQALYLDDNSDVIEKDCTTIPLPPWAMSVTPGANADYYARSVRLDVGSPIHPDTAMDIHMCSSCISGDGGKIAPAMVTVPHSTPPLGGIGGYIPDAYTCRQVWVPNLGTFDIPVTLVTAATTTTTTNTTTVKHPTPCLVVVYAAYGHTLPLDFLPERIPLLDRGWVIALVHARGGGELGRQWHAAGRGLDNKHNSARDVLTSIDWLIDNNYTQGGMVAIEGSSAGGVAVGAAVNARPDLFGAVLLESPFLDVATAMCDPQLPLTQHEYDEFGDPGAPGGIQKLLALSPYHNVGSASSSSTSGTTCCYPPMFITCSSTDERVPVWGVMKYAAKVRHCRGGGESNVVWVMADAHEGHLAEDRERMDVKSMQYAFVIDAIEERKGLIQK